MRPPGLRLLYEALLASAEEAPDRTAVITHDERVSYAELLDRARRIAVVLQDRGVERGDRVAIFMDNSVTAVAAIYGASMAGGAFMFVNPQTKQDKLRYILNDSGTSAMIADDRLVSIAEGAAAGAPALRVLLATRGDAPRSGSVEDLEDALAATRHGPRSVGSIALDLAALVYTSGSTGNPKGVMLSHQNMVFTTESLIEYLRLSSADRILNVLPLAFDYGLYQAIMAIRLAATLVLEPSFAFPAHVVTRVQEEGVTVIPGVPTVFARLIALHRSHPITMPTVRTITNTAAHLPDDYVPILHQMSPGAAVYKMYGLTECKRVSYLDPDLIGDRPASVGKAIPGTEVQVLDDDRRPVAAGERGVLYVRGPHVMMGYWNLPEETARVLVPGRYHGERMLCTHDVFRMDADGFLYFVGRKDDIIKSRGEKVSPVEVENVLHGIPGVREAAVIGVPDDVLGEAVRAYVVMSDGAVADERAFRRQCMARLENHMVPRDVVFLDELPKTSSGKVRKQSLRDHEVASKEEAMEP